MNKQMNFVWLAETVWNVRIAKAINPIEVDLSNYFMEV